MFVPGFDAEFVVAPDHDRGGPIGSQAAHREGSNIHPPCILNGFEGAAHPDKSRWRPSEKYRVKDTHTAIAAALIN